MYRKMVTGSSAQAGQLMIFSTKNIQMAARLEASSTKTFRALNLSRRLRNNGYRFPWQMGRF